MQEITAGKKGQSRVYFFLYASGISLALDFSKYTTHKLDPFDIKLRTTE